MKVSASLLFVCLALTASADLVAHWQGTSGKDDRGHNSATLLGGARITQGAFDFSGDVNEVAFIPDDGSLALTKNLTISCWVYPREFASPNATSPQSQILFRGDDLCGRDPYDLLLLRNGLYQFKINSETEECVIQAPALLFEWTHLMAVLDAELGTMRLYVNGELMAQTFTNVRPFKDLDKGCSPGIAIGNVQFPSGPYHRQPFNGFIRDVRLYDSVEKPTSSTSAFPIDAIFP